MSLKKIDNNLGRINTNGNKLNDLIHETAMLILNHAMKTGDCTRALSLVKQMPASMRRTTVVQWFTKYSPIRVVFQNDAVGMLSKSDKGYVGFNLDKADANPFYKIAEANVEPSLLDFDKFIKMIQNMAKREAAKADEGRAKPEDVASIKAACEVLAGLKFTRVAPANDEEGAGEEMGEVAKLAAVA
jgi:hypothetical protein